MADSSAGRRPGVIELSVALAALVVSAASLFVAQRQTHVMGRQLAASVWPIVEYTTGNFYEGESQIFMSLRNSGIGPAQIRSFRVSYKGAPVRDVEELLAACCATEAQLEDIDGVATSEVVDAVIPAGREVAFLTLHPTISNDAAYTALAQARLDVAVSTCYCSVVEDCWLTTWEFAARSQRPQQVDSCAREQQQVQYSQRP